MLILNNQIENCNKNQTFFYEIYVPAFSKCLFNEFFYNFDILSCMDQMHLF